MVNTQEPIWFKSYPAGVPHTVDVDRYTSLVAMFDAHCTLYGNQSAFVYFGHHISFLTLKEQAEFFAAFLQKRLALKKGDRIALILPNVLSFPIALYGALKAGLIVIPVNPLYTARELKIQLVDADVAAVIVLENFTQTLSTILPETSVRHVILAKAGDVLPWLKQKIINFISTWKRKICFSFPTIIFFEQALKIGKTLSLDAISIQAEDLAFLQYTGGTTGTPKGAMLSHRNMMANVWQSLAWVKTVLNSGEERVLTALPLYHIFSLTVCFFCFLTLGGQNILIPDPRRMKFLIYSIRRYKPTVIVGINTLFRKLLENKNFLKLNFSSLKLVIGGGMGIQKSVADAWQVKTGTVLIEGYGLTEASPVVTINPPTLKTFNGSIGLPIPSTEVAILNNHYEPQPCDTLGEIAVKGPQVMKGYWKNPKETQSVLVSNWLLTGDLGKLDENGFVYLIDRKKDMILVSGFNVYPSEIEAVLTLNPKIKEVAVIGVPDARTGEAVKAFIVPADSALTEEEVKAYCRERLTHYKIPKIIEFRNELPHSNVGKILRRVLRGENNSPNSV